MYEKRRILFAGIISSIAIAAPLSSFAQECDGDYYAGIGANQHYASDKRQPTNSYLFKHKATQQRLQKTADAAENRPPT